MPALGGTKTFEPAAVLALKPDLVLAAKEENPKGKVEALASHVPVLVADPRGPREVPDLWRMLGSALGAEKEAEERAREVQGLVAGTKGPPIPCVYFVWKDPYMAAGPDTYVSHLLSAVGFANVVPAGKRRYPVVDAALALSGEVRVHFYPDEPYAFALPVHLQQWGTSVEEKPGHFLLARRIVCFGVCGADFTWYPSRTAVGLRSGRELHQRFLTVAACLGPR